MPFKSEKQRKWMWANDPEMAKDWEKKDESLSTSQAKAAHDKFKKTGELPPHLKKLVKKIKKFEKDAGVKNIVVPGLEWMSNIKESDLGLTYKKGKTVKVKHKTSGKSLIIIDKPNVRKEYEKIGFFAEGSCGYGIDGKVGSQPAGPHLIKKKKKKVDEGQKRDANNLAVEFGKSFQRFTVAVNGLAKSMTNITGDKTDEKIIMKAFKKHIIPFGRLVDSWNSGQQKNPNIDEKVIKVSKKDDVPGNPMKMSGEEKIKKLVYSGSNGTGSYEIKGKNLNVIGIRPRDKGFFVRHFTMKTGFRKANLYYDGVSWMNKNKKF